MHSAVIIVVVGDHKSLDSVSNSLCARSEECGVALGKYFHTHIF